MIGKLHHIGIASRNIEKDIEFFSLFGYVADGVAHEDLTAGIRVQFLAAEGQPLLELVQNLGKDGPVTPHLQVKRKIFHFAYETNDIAGDAQRVIDDHAGLFLVPITKAPHSPKIDSWCYVACRNMMIIELVQHRKA